MLPVNIRTNIKMHEGKGYKFESGEILLFLSDFTFLFPCDCIITDIVEMDEETKNKWDIENDTIHAQKENKLKYTTCAYYYEFMAFTKKWQSKSLAFCERN